MIKTDFNNHIGFLVHEVARLMSVEYDARMKPLGLTRAQWWVLATLYFQDGVTQSELAETLASSRVTLGGLLDRLEAKGWVERRADRQDRRAKRVFLTAKVQPLVNEMGQVAQKMTSDLTQGLSKEDKDRLVSYLNVIKNNLYRRSHKPLMSDDAVVEAVG